MTKGHQFERLHVCLVELYVFCSYIFQGAWCGGLTSGRRLDNANHQFREHQLPGHDDRGEGCRHDSCKSKMEKNEEEK